MSIQRGGQGRLFAEHAYDSRPSYTAHGMRPTEYPAQGYGPTAHKSWTDDQGRKVQRAASVGKWAEKPVNEPLRMFMKPGEILATHGPHDPDRLITKVDYTATKSPVNEYGDPNDSMVRVTGNEVRSQRTTGGSKMYTGFSGVKETDEQLWDRKYKEAYDPHGHQGAAAGYAEPLGDSMRRHKGDVSGSITLGTARNMNNQRSIAGGHHRIAVAAEEYKDQYLPVQHLEGQLTIGAKRSKDYT